MPAVPTHLRPPAASARPAYTRSYATAAEASALARLLASGPSPFIGKDNQYNRRMAVATIQGMTDDAVRNAGLTNVPVELRDSKPGDDRAFFWGAGDPGQKPRDYGIVIRPDYLGAPRGLDATIRHEVAHARDTLRNNSPSLIHGPSFRAEENSQFVPGVKLKPYYRGDDYAGADEYADDFNETGEEYRSNVFLSNYDDARVRPQRVAEKDLKKAIAKNKKAYVANLKNPPAPKLRVGPAVRGL